jgi:hypothetical protein
MTLSPERPKAVKPKKNYKEIKEQRLLQAKAQIMPKPTEDFFKGKRTSNSDQPAKTEFKKPEFKTNKKEAKPKTFVKKSASPRSGPKSWEKRKGTGTTKPWKKTPGGIKKKFRFER